MKLRLIIQDCLLRKETKATICRTPFNFAQENGQTERSRRMVFLNKRYKLFVVNQFFSGELILRFQVNEIHTGI